MPQAPVNCRLLLRCALLWAGLAGASVASAAATLGGSIAASSDYILRGVSQNDNEPVVQLDLHLQAADSWSAGVWTSPVQLLPGKHSLEVDVYGQWRLPLGAAASATLGATWYTYPSDPRQVSYDYVEYTAGISWRDRVALRGYYAPHATLYSSVYRYLLYRATWSAELGLAQPLPRQFSATAGLGYYDVVGLSDAGYTYGNLAVGRNFGRIHTELSYVAVAATARRGYTQGPAGRPLNLSLAWHF